MPSSASDLDYTISSRAVIGTIKQHVPSISNDDEGLLYERMTRIGGIDEGVNVADLALRTCRCGVRIDGFYQYIDHLVEVFGGESHIRRLDAKRMTHDYLVTIDVPLTVRIESVDDEEMAKDMAIERLDEVGLVELFDPTDFYVQPLAAIRVEQDDETRDERLDPDDESNSPRQHAVAMGLQLRGDGSNENVAAFVDAIIAAARHQGRKHA